MNKVCEHCGVGYTSKQPNSKYCTIECQSKSYRLRKGKKTYSKVCSYCKTEYDAKDYRQKYCSRSCAAKINNVVVPKRGIGRLYRDTTCMYQNCSNLLGEKQKTFCSLGCRHQESVREWLLDGSLGTNKYTTASFVYKYMLEECGGRCEGTDTRTGERCIEDRVKPSGATILQLDHIDGNWQNNNRNNLRMLCPTCHCLTETYGIGNLGNGRAWRRLGKIESVC